MARSGRPRRNGSVGVQIEPSAVVASLPWNPDWAAHFLHDVLYEDLVVGLYVDPIVPGQDLSFSFDTSFLVVRDLDLGKVTMTLHLVNEAGNLVFGQANPLWAADLDPLIAAAIEAGPYHTMTFKVTPPADRHNRVWSVNANNFLRLVLSGTGKDGGPYTSGDVALPVNYEVIDSSWWDWADVPFEQIVDWKTGVYSLYGVVHNKSQYSLMNFNVTLIENQGDPSESQFPPDQHPAAVPKLGSASITYGGHQPEAGGKALFSKSWAWFQSGTYAPTDGTNRTYFYTVQLDISDEWENSGGPYRPDPGMFGQRIITVQVSDQKMNGETAAFTSFVAWAAISTLAASLAWLPGAGAVLGAVAGAAASAWATAGKIADDPPTPDPRYKRHVTRSAPKLPKILRSPRYERLSAALETTLWILESIEALGRIESRILGATRARNRRAEELQRKDYAAITRELRRLAPKLAHLATPATEELATTNVLTPVDIAVWTKGQGNVRQIPNTSAVKEARSALSRLNAPEVAAIQLADPAASFGRACAAVRNLALVSSRRKPQRREGPRRRRSRR